MNAVPSHTVCPSKHRTDMIEESAIPVLFQDAPTAFNGIIFTMVRGIVKQLDGFTDLVGKSHHALEKLGSDPTTFWPVIDFELKSFHGVLFCGWQGFPPVL